MEEDNINNASGSGGQNNNQNNQNNPPYRVRRPSTSIISSTTPMFQPPQNPTPTNRQRLGQHNMNHNFGPGDIDDDVQPQSTSSSSSSSSLRGRLSAALNSVVGSGNNSSSSNNNSNSNNRPQSPLGSPDSTAYWAPSPVGGHHHHSSNASTSYRSPLTPGGMCVVSSSTSDDIPQSPFSPEELSNHGFPQPPPPAPVLPSRATDNREDFNIGNRNQVPRRRPSLVASSSSSSSSLNLSLSASLLSNNINNSNRSFVGGNNNNSQQLQQSENQDLNQNRTSAGPSSSSSSAHQSFNISPLRNKIKKASSFERFSLAQAAIISNSSGNNANSAASSQNAANNESSISSLPPNLNNSSMGTATNSNSIQRAIWEPSPNPATTDNNNPPSTSSAMGSLRSSFTTHGHTEKFHIKIPSKKLAAKIASVYEQEKLNEQFNAQLAAAEAISVVGSASSKRPSSSLSSGGLTSSVIASISQNDGLLSSQTQNNSSNNSNSQNPPSTLAQILNQSSNIHMIPDESINAINQQDVVNHENLIRELSEAPLNLTDNNTGTTNSSITNTSSSITTTSHHTQQHSLLRNPVISSRGNLTKKILTPKQKLLHRLQSGELMASLSPPPQPTVTLSQHIQQSLPIQQQQQQSVSSPVVTLHQSIITTESMQNNGINHVISISNSSQHSPPQQQQQQQQLDQYSYDSLLRSRDDFVVQDSLVGKMVGEDPNNAVSNMLSAYDPADAYSYYSYQNILGDEIFTGNNSANNSNRHLLMMPGNLATMDQPQGPLEFVLGFSNTVDDHDGGERGRDDDLQLNNIDPNDDALSAIKSQNPTDSTLRNLLMMEPMRNNQNDDNAWLALAAAEYQNRINPESAISISRGGGGSIMRGSSSSGLGNIVGGSSSSVVSNNQGAGGISNSWVNEWPRSSWQTHNSIGVQDEVMDMSMMDHVKGPMSNQMKRLQMQMQGANNDHASSIDEIDLTTGLPILSQMSVNMPIDLQQPMSIMSHGGGNSKDTLPIDLQQHHRMEIDDEPVNLMAVNMEQDQELVHHHHHNSHSSSSSSSSSHLNQSHSHLEQSSSKMMHHQNNSNYHSPSSQDLQSVSDLNLNNANSNSPPSDIIDERRIIRVKKTTKDTLIMSNLNDVYQLSAEDQEHANIIMDKPIEPKSIASLPSPFRFSRVENNEIAVFNDTNRNIPPNCRLGPLEGPLRKAIGDVSNMNASYPSILMADGNNILWQLDRSDDELCNWMKFVRLAHSIKDQNAQVVESDGYLYFMTCKEITPNTELQVGYSYEYAQKYSLPIFLPTDAFVDHEENDRINKQNDNNLAKTCNSDNNSPNNDSQQPIQMIQDDDEDIDDEPLADREEEQEESRNMTIETYQCFECDQEFSLVEELQAHLNTHKDTEPIRKPKKKAIRKFQTPEINNIERNMPAINNNNDSDNNQQIEKEPSQQMNADSSSTIVVEVGGQQSMQSSSSSGNCSIQRSVEDIGKQQDNSVTTGVGQPAPPPKVKCSMCYKSFLNKERLEKHMIVHSDEDTKPLKCNFCVKRFLTNSALAGHIKTHSEEGKFFECPMCIFSTPQLLMLKEHVQTHKNRETGFFYCPKCPKKFTAYSMIRKHIRAFHGPRQFTCEHEDCPMSFPTSDKLKLHQLKHSDHREFLCSECGKQFKRKDKLREHTKRIHETRKKSIEINIPKDKNSKKFIPKVAPEEYEKFPFKCQDCMVGFKRRGMLVNHLAKRHPEKKIKSIPELNQPILRLTRNYPCLYCERIYKSSSKRKAHILKAHPGRPVPPQLRGNGSNNNKNAIIEAAVASSVVVNEVVRPTAGTIVQTVTEDGDPRTGIMNVSCNNNTSENNLVSTTSTSQSLRKEASIVGKVAALPHACQFCYREYATRAKLLQHQRKAHINLMPAEMQTPRTQKNNVQSKKDKAEATSNKSVIKLEGIANMIQQKEPTLIIPDSTSASTSTIQTVTSVSAEGLNEGSVIGYLLTTSSGDLGNLIPSELVMFGGPLTNLGNGEPTSILSSQPQTMNVNPSQNITILASTSNNPNSKNSSM